MVLGPAPAAVPGGQPAAVLAFDVGGTDIKAGLVDGEGTVLGMRRVPTPLDPHRPAEVILDRLSGLAAELASEFPGIPPAAAGIVVPGIVDPVAGIGIYSANLRWRDFPFTAEGSRRLGVPVAFDHDVRSAAAVEHRYGASREFGDVLVMVVGTGIAAAVFSGDRAVTAGGYAGELGHALVPDPDGPGTVILESLGSAGGIAKRFAAATGEPISGARTVLERARAGDATAARIWSEAIDALAFSICQCVSIIGTEAVVIGGGLAEAGEELLEPLRRRIDAMLDFHRRPVILRAHLGQDAGLLGAALNARNLVAGMPSQVEHQSGGS
ncbi:ROK family protein [Pseudarthrobacter sp. J75]|uniref:ROK family protein n=1 Tax=unclassified Pseudarthrobacter TaxID=2647000 RepID=UPI002E81D505|nr:MULTISPECIES: ROK family protein [unclassified Pseudarthrobacter]MEE2521727.1 ROK family protein [Pseudarthrobacter sp. J47]MEE2527804.1 ROK family protein [Pseudarthrobacter sp. J75]MEE2569372.1 ROK family protein [Pseudarthrobacter sp. J64]